MGSFSDFLFGCPSFLSGWASILDLGATGFQFNEALTPNQADYIAMRQDWRAVGRDLQVALDSMPEERKRGETEDRPAR